MARALGPSCDLPELLETAAEEARGALRAASVSVSRLRPGSLVIRTIVNVGDLGPHEVRWPTDETYVMTEFADLDLGVDRVVSWARHLDDPDLAPHERALLEDLGKGSSLSAPVVVDGELWGEVYATRHRGEAGFDRNDVAYLEALLAILAGAISRAGREETLTQLAFRDPLTGLLNRRALDEAAAAAFTVRAGETRQVAVVVVDINGLKAVNDTLGHDAGDRLIQSVGRSLLDSFSTLSGSLVARVGGDEFTVLVIGRSVDEVVAVADQVSGGHVGTFHGGLSSGVAGLLVDQHTLVTPSILFAAADKAQYVAKREHLSTTVVAPPLKNGHGRDDPSCTSR